MLLFAGDPHGEFRVLHEAVDRLEPDSVVLLGDQQPSEADLRDLEAKTQVYYILGNHDSEQDGKFLDAHDAALPPERDLNARVVDFGGVRVAGLGGIWRGTIWHPQDPNKGGKPTFRSRQEYDWALTRRHRWRGGLPPYCRTSIWAEDYDKLAGMEADILVTHQAPRPHHYGFDEIDQLAQVMGVSMVIYGHHHVATRTAIPTIAGDGWIRVVGAARPENPGHVVDEQGEFRHRLPVDPVYIPPPPLQPQPSQGSDDDDEEEAAFDP